MSRLLVYLRPHLPRMSVGFAVKFLGTVMDLLIPWILAHLIDDIVPLKNVPLVFLWGALMLVCSGVAVLTNIAANRMASKVAAETTRKLRHDLFGRIAWLSCRQTDDFTIPSLISRLTSDTYNIHQMVGMMQRLGVRAPIILLGGVVITLTLDPVLTLVLLCVLPFMAVVVYFVSKKGVPLYGALQQTVDKLVRVVRENITGIRVIKALSRTDYEKNRFAGVNAETVRSETKAGTVMALTNPLMNLFLNLGLTAVVLVGAYRVNGGMSQPGKIIAFLTYFTIILNAMLSVTRIFMLVSRGHASFLRIRGVLDSPGEPVLHKPDVVKSEYHVAFDHVSFSYRKQQNDLSDISFHLKRGETLGIIGTTGSGKSSIIKLLMRFYDADAGTVRIDGRNVNCIPGGELYTMFGIVFQNDVLFAETIAENIDFGRGLPREEIKRSTALAQAGEFIESLSDGWEHELTARGSNLSGGQKQRILISRALAGDPEILILDDSSNALDYKTDAKLRESLRKNDRKATTIIVAQRISSIMHADHILVLDDGRSIGYGTHGELMERCESYREIARSQMGGQANG